MGHLSSFWCLLRFFFFKNWNSFWLELLQDILCWKTLISRVQGRIPPDSISQWLQTARGYFIVESTYGWLSWDWTPCAFFQQVFKGSMGYTTGKHSNSNIIGQFKLTYRLSQHQDKNKSRSSQFQPVSAPSGFDRLHKVSGAISGFTFLKSHRALRWKSWDRKLKAN